jgi:hypothetical protein
MCHFSDTAVLPAASPRRLRDLGGTCTRQRGPLFKCQLRQRRLCAEGHGKAGAAGRHPSQLVGNRLYMPIAGLHCVTVPVCCDEQCMMVPTPSCLCGRHLAGGRAFCVMYLLCDVGCCSETVQDTIPTHHNAYRAQSTEDGQVYGRGERASNMQHFITKRQPSCK